MARATKAPAPAATARAIASIPRIARGPEPPDPASPEPVLGATGVAVGTAVGGAVAGKEFEFVDRGEVSLKGFDEPVRAWSVEW